MRGCASASAAVIVLAILGHASPAFPARRSEDPRSVPAGVAFPSGWRFAAGAEPVVAEHGMVVAAEGRAARVGLQVLESGGSAVDAAVATAFALAVTYPRAGNIGGGGFLVVRTAEDESAALDFRERAPLAATREMFLDEDGEVSDASLYGVLAAGVPGSVLGLWEAHQRFGVLPWRDLVLPAARLAAEGFEVDAPFRKTLELLERKLREHDGEVYARTREAFLPLGAPAPLGARFRQPELAATLRRIAEHGPEDFYRGRTAELLLEEMRRSGGLVSASDLRSYTAGWREPVSFTYRGHTVISMPPPSSGGVTLALTARLLEPFDLGALGLFSSRRIHLLVEALRRAFADRNTYLGDPDFVSMPLDTLLSPAYPSGRRPPIDPERASPSSEVAPGLDPIEEGESTTHVSVVDAAGNAASLTTTINTSFGSLVTVRGAGFLLNNEMDDFTSRPGTPNTYGLVQGEANAIEGGKRMLSSMSPTIVLDPGGRLFLVTGSPGGGRIISAVFQTISYAVDHGLGVADLVSAPRVHHQHLPDEIVYELGGLTLEAFEELDEMGHEFRPIAGVGEVEVILVRPDGTLTGFADPRGSGLAAGY
jgi:gamma-glutamyltranspeptidase/glutathione hydrolase